MGTVKTHTYEHPAWDMKLILEASVHSRAQAEENLSDEDDKALLVMTEGEMSRSEFRDLPEWDG